VSAIILWLRVTRRPGVHSIYPYVERIGGKMIQLSSSAILLLIVLAVLIFLLGVSLLAAHIVEIHHFGSKDY
jgi:hypothetical protein